MPITLCLHTELGYGLEQVNIGVEDDEFSEKIQTSTDICVLINCDRL